MHLTSAQKLSHGEKIAQVIIKAILGISLNNVGLNTFVMPKTRHLELEVCKTEHL